MIESRQIQIGGATYTVTQLPARRAIRLKAKLIKYFGPAFAQMAISATEKDSDNQKKIDLIRAVETLAHSIDENLLEQLILEMMQGVRKDGIELTPALIDNEFAGDMASLYQILSFVVEINFANFFSLIGIGSPSFSPEKPQADVTKKTFAKS